MKEVVVRMTSFYIAIFSHHTCSYVYVRRLKYIINLLSGGNRPTYCRLAHLGRLFILLSMVGYVCYLCNVALLH